VDIQQRYVAAVLWYSTLGILWGKSSSTTGGDHGGRTDEDNDRILQEEGGNTYDGNSTINPTTNEDDAAIDNSPKFLTGSDVCFWNTPDGLHGFLCDEDGLIRELQFGTTMCDHSLWSKRSAKHRIGCGRATLTTNQIRSAICTTSIPLFLDHTNAVSLLVVVGLTYS
jgi:hypothetical protein